MRTFSYYWSIRKCYCLRRFIWNYRRVCRREIRQPFKPDELLRHGYFESVYEAYKQQIKTQENDSLLTKAQKILTLEPLSVEQKTHIPSSGCANDYLSFAPYYWNDEGVCPTEKASTPNEYRDGRPNPLLASMSDKPILAQMCARVHLLAIAWLVTKNPKYLTHIYAQLEVWFINESTCMTPHMRFAQLMPWGGRRQGLGIIDARWFILLIDALVILEKENALKMDYKVSVMSWFQKFADWALSSASGLIEVAMKNNRGSWIDALLAYINLALNKEKSAQCIVKFGLCRRPIEQFNEYMQQPQELRRYTYVSYSLYNLYPLFYLYHINQWSNNACAMLNEPRKKKLDLLFEEFENLTQSIEKHEEGKIEFIDFTEKFSLNLYYPYSFAQLKYFPGISPFQQ